MVEIIALLHTDGPTLLITIETKTGRCAHQYIFEESRE